MSRCALKLDANADGVVTISDLPKAAWRAICYPGDWLLDAIAADPKLATFFELHNLQCGGGAAFVLSVFAYMVAFYLWAVAMVELIRMGAAVAEVVTAAADLLSYLWRRR